VAEVARQTDVPESTLRYDLDKLDKALPEVLVNHPPGPQPRSNHSAEAPEKSDKQEEPLTCPGCGGQVKKNGTYWVLNWVLMLTMGWRGVQKVLLQRWRCKRCGRELISTERGRQTEARQAWWQQVNRLIALSRFKLRLSVRLTQVLVKFVYARAVSVGHIERVTQQAGQQAKGALGKLKQCRQAVGHFLLFDETFPKMKERGYSLGVAICEHGLIRSVRCLTHKAKGIPAQLADVVGEHFQPTYFLTDLDVLYHKCMQEAGLNLTHLRDKVHLIRQIVRLFDQAIRDVILDIPKRLPLRERKKQRQLKRRLLRKQLQPLLALVFKAFTPGYEGLCVLLLEGLVSQLQDPTVVIQTASVQTLSRRLQRFVNKHGDAINLLLQLSVEQDTPTTTNSLESKNSLLKPFSRIAKFFPELPTCETFFCGVALMENFDVKSRGSNKGTSAMQRAKINMEDFGATDFFSAVNLPEPQISLAHRTYW
jgi:transposase-like protein